MDADAPRDPFGHFQQLQDPRGPSRWHRMDEMLMIAILAVLCGASGWTEVQQFGQAKIKWLKTFLTLPHGIPSHDTFGRLFAALDPTQLEQCFINWTASLAKSSGGKLVAIDGKTIRRSFDRASGKAAIHMISAFAADNHLVLGQLACEVKSNEITALPRLLKLLDLRGATVTVDALHCQKDTATAIRNAGANYLMQVKANQPSLHEDVKLFFDEAIAHRWEHTGHAFHETVEKDHGRIEIRRCWSTWEINWLQRRVDWPGLGSIVCIEAQRTVDGRTSCERRYFLSSLEGRDAAAMLAATRGHWSIENRLHWCLDVCFGEDQCRLRQGHAAENFSRLNRLCTNRLRQDRTLKVGLRAKRLRAGWDHEYLLHLISTQ